MKSLSEIIGEVPNKAELLARVEEAQKKSIESRMQGGKTHGQMIGEAQNRFVESRRGESKKYTKEILKFLLDRRDRDPEGWVRAYELRDQKICNEQNLFRLLKDLSQDSGNIIQRKEKSSNEVYYRIPPSSESVWFFTYEEMYAINKKEIDTLTAKNIDLEFDLIDALWVIENNKLYPEYEKMREETRNTGEGYEKWKERKLGESQIKSSSI